MENRLLPARTAGIMGIVFVVAVAVPGFATGSPPDPADAAAKWLAYYQSNRSGLVVQQLLGMVGSLFAFFYFAKLVTTTRRVEGYNGPLSVVAVVSIAVVATMASVGGALQAAAAFRLGLAEHADAVTVQALGDASSICFAFLGVPLAAFLVTQGLLLRGSRVPRWLGSLFLAMAVLEVLSACTVLGTTGQFSPMGAASLLLGLLPLAVSTLAAAITMIVRPTAFDATTAAAAVSAAPGTAVSTAPAAG